MANIATLLQNIRVAAYGEDVRSAVYEALKAINEESEGAMGGVTDALNDAKQDLNSASEELTQKIQEITTLKDEIETIRDDILNNSGASSGGLDENTTLALFYSYMQFVFPIGSIIVSMDSDFDPNARYNMANCWEKWNGGYTLVSAHELCTDNDFKQSGTTGGNQSHNNMPPYKTVYIWQRIQ